MTSIVLCSPLSPPQWETLTNIVKPDYHILVTTKIRKDKSSHLGEDSTTYRYRLRTPYPHPTLHILVIANIAKTDYHIWLLQT